MRIKQFSLVEQGVGGDITFSAVRSTAAGRRVQCWIACGWIAITSGVRDACWQAMAIIGQRSRTQRRHYFVFLKTVENQERRHNVILSPQISAGADKCQRPA